jgi:NADH dehydrogenase
MIIVTGASSFVGAHIVRALVERDDVAAVVNQSTLQLGPDQPARVMKLDLTAPSAAGALAALGPSHIVHMACKAMDADPGPTNLAMLRTVITAAKQTGATVIHGSTTQVGWPVLNAYAQGRRAEEEELAAGGVPFVALRPCAPYGPMLERHSPRHRESFHTLADLVRRMPILPLPGGGTMLRQPVHVTDFAEVAIHFLTHPAPNQAFDVGGPVRLSLARIVDVLAFTLGRKLLTVPVPLTALRLAALLPGISAAQLTTFATDDVVDTAPVIAATGKTAWVDFTHGAVDVLGPRTRYWTR